MSRGVCRASGAPSIREEAVWATRLSLEPAALAYLRDSLACVISHNTAAWLMGLGELNPEPLTFTSAVRRQVQRDGLRVVRGKLLSGEVHTVAGFSCATASRTVCDLVVDGEDLSLVSAVLRDALSAGLVTDEVVLRRDVDALDKKRGLADGISLYEILRRG